MEPQYDIRSPRFESLIRPEARLQQLGTGYEWAEGPVWFADGQYLLWSDIPNNRMLRWVEGGVTVFRQPSRHTNGHTRDREGRLISCEHSGRRISRTEHDGTVVPVVGNYEGKKLNSPNDVVVKSDRTIWFTDPPYGILSDREGYKADSELGRNYVFRFLPDTGELRIVGDDFDRPNGICFSPDERTLYVSDTGEPGHMRAFDVAPDGTLSNSRVFARPDTGKSDGFRADTEGNIWTSAGDGIHVFTPEGELLGKVLVPEVVANCTFGGPERRTLFITANSSLYSIEVAAAGALRP